MGALPPHRLPQSAAGGGLLADLPTKAFCIKWQHSSIFKDGKHELQLG